MTLLEEFARLLAERGLGTYSELPGGDVFLVELPDLPDLATAVSLYAGPEADARLAYDEPSVQYRCRAPKGDSRVALARAQAIYDALHGLGSRELPGGTWLQLMTGAQSGPIPLGRDQNGRHEWTVNFRTEVQRITANRG